MMSGLIKGSKRFNVQKPEYMSREDKRIYVRDSAVGECNTSTNHTGAGAYFSDETVERQSGEQLFQSQRLERVWTLVGGISS